MRGEVPRLLAWLLKYCRSFKPFHEFLKVDGTVKCIVEMISSNHAVMQNEAFYALYLLCQLCLGCPLPDANLNNSSSGADPAEKCDSDQDVLFQLFVDADLGKHLHYNITKYGEKMEKHLLENLLRFLEQLANSDLMKSHFKSIKLTDAFVKFLQNKDADDLMRRIRKLTSLIDN